MLRKQIKQVINPRDFKITVKPIFIHKSIESESESEPEYLPESGSFPKEQIQLKKKQTTKT